MGLAWCSPLACYRALYNGARNESTPICGIGLRCSAAHCRTARVAQLSPMHRCVTLKDVSTGVVWRFGDCRTNSTRRKGPRGTPAACRSAGEGLNGPYSGTLLLLRAELVLATLTKS